MEQVLMKEFNAEAARALVQQFQLSEEAAARDQLPGVMKKIKVAADGGHNFLMINLEYKYLKIVSEELKSRGFSIKLDTQGRDGCDNSYSINW